MRHPDRIEDLMCSCAFLSALLLKPRVETKKGHPMGTLFIWWSQAGSNCRPPACKAGALPAELWPQKLVLVLGIEPQPGNTYYVSLAGGSGWI